MPRVQFDQELNKLKSDLAEMGSQVNALMQGTMRCLKNMDLEQAKKIFSHDTEFNSMERTIEQSCMNLLALQQPLATDLRRITATLKVITDIERIADQCADICEIIGTVLGIATLRATPQLLKMFEKAQAMFSKSIEAYLNEDVELAAQVCKDDDEVDALFSSNVLELCSRMSQEQSDVPEQVDFLFITKYIERMADHATNIAEWAIFIKTGLHPDLNDTLDESK